MSRPSHIPPKTTGRTKYTYGIDHYAQLYEIPRATILKYHRKNYPLDDPKALLDIIMEQKAHNKPPLKRLTELARGGQVKPSPKPRVRVPGRGVPRAEFDEPPVELPTFDTSLKGLHFEMARLKFETDEAYGAYRREPDAVLKAAHWKIWKEMLQQWGTLAKIAPESERELGNLAKAGDLESTWSRTCKEIRTQLESTKRRMSAHHIFKGLNPVDVELAFENEIVRVMTILSDGEFLMKKAE